MSESERVASLQDKMQRVQEEVGKKIVGQRKTLENVLVCMMCDGNALLEGNPGLGKTLMIRTISEVTDLDFSRIQNTPDLMPSDITGTEVIRETESGKVFTFEKGPIFSNMVLADEINRATPKTQAALLEAMQEKQVTASGKTYELPEPFFLLATQNPIDQEGTYPLPEAQSDRFMMKIVFDYPGFDEEVEIVERYTKSLEHEANLNVVLSGEELRRIQELTREVPISDDLVNKAVQIVSDTRKSDQIEYGASPRASLSLVLASKARAFLEGRAYVKESDIDEMAVAVLRHRIIVDFRAEREGVTPEDAIQNLL